MRMPAGLRHNDDSEEILQKLLSFGRNHECPLLKYTHFLLFHFELLHLR